MFRGLSLPIDVVEKWKRKKVITLDGYSSSSQSENIARFFAKNSAREGNQLVLLKIRMKNESGKHYFSLDSP